MLVLKKIYGKNIIQVLMVVTGAFNGDTKFAHKKKNHHSKAHSLHFSFIIIYEESESNNLHENIGSLSSLQWI